MGARIFNVKLNMVSSGAPATGKISMALILGFCTSLSNSMAMVAFVTVTLNPSTTAALAATAAKISKFRNTRLLKFTYPDGTAVAGSLHYAISTSLLTLGGNVPLVNGQATCALVSSPNVLGLIGQTQVALNLTDATGTMVWQVAMGLNPANADLSSVQNSPLNVVLTKP